MSARAPGAGARRGRSQSLLVEHGRAAREGWEHIRGSPAATLLGIAVMAVALGLPALLDALLENQRVLFERWGGEPSLTAFLDPLVDAATAQALARELAGAAEIAGVEFVDAATALAEFNAQAGFRDAGPVADNPLPHILVISLRPEVWAADRGAALLARVEELDQVDRVMLDTEWVERLVALAALARRGVALLALILGGATVLVVGNTIRVLVQQQIEVIEVQKLVGATDAFVRRPFLYSGALHGLLAGLLALLLVEGVFAALAEPMARVAAAYLSNFTLRGLPATHAAGLVAVSTLFGWCGAWVGTGLNLRRLVPVGGE